MAEFSLNVDEIKQDVETSLNVEKEKLEWLLDLSFDLSNKKTKKKKEVVK